MTDSEAKVLTDLAITCALACVTGQQTATISTRGKRPLGFPRGELLSVGTNGAHNYAVCPVKVLAWIHTRTKGRRLVDESKTPNCELTGAR